LIERLLSDEGWPYASSEPVDASDPGRFHALFGRDSLITSLQLLPSRPDVARATLRKLASLQGVRDDPETDEEPGKIVHEYRPHAEQRFLDMGWPVHDGELRYYGSADGTSWFLVVLDALGDAALAGELSDAWRGASDWLVRALERGGGLVRWGPRLSSGGLLQQGWRDTTGPQGAYGGGILNADGSAPEPPVADADTQAVAVRALRATARLSGEERFGGLAAELAARIGEAFDPNTMALDRDGARVLGAGSQLGWLLWADGPADDGARERFAARLCEPDVLTDFGVRTLSSSHPQFDAHAYHRGAVWPFDSWICWGGLRAAGRDAEAERVRSGVLEAVARLGDAPELYAVTGSGPQRIEIANRVQAWTVGAIEAFRSGWDGRG